jgi:hypothetical protein
MAFQKNVYLLVDTETADDIRRPKVYDIAWLVMTRGGEVLKTFNAVNYNVYEDNSLMDCAYYGTKRPEYDLRIKRGEVAYNSPGQIIAALKADIKTYSITHFAAYNSPFDKRAIKSTFGYITPFMELIELDIWTLVVHNLIGNKKYARWAVETGNVTEAGNVKTSAEAVYRYIFRDNSFIENHTALQDCFIERQLLLKAWATRKKIPSPMPESFAWRHVQQFLPAAAE